MDKRYIQRVALLNDWSISFAKGYLIGKEDGLERKPMHRIGQVGRTRFAAGYRVGYCFYKGVRRIA